MAAPRPWREVATGYDAGAATYDERHGAPADPASRRRTARIEAPLLAAVRGRGRLLELGVGTGRLLAQLARSGTGARTAIGVDISAAMLAEAARKSLTVLRADAHRLPFAAARFDAILAGGGVFRYLDTDAALTECARVLAPGGVLAIHQFGAATFRLRGGARAPDPRVRELRHVDELLVPASAAGFDVVRLVRTRSLPVAPYVVEIPGWLDRASPRQLWSQVVVILRRRA
ncbi:MAG TPA: class I SAM-dependent methyltransferase [Kofleriaceae bacterium]|nr:class I SAM-dependent methyltransferase [Kofleriaceae bacterium]